MLGALLALLVSLAVVAILILVVSKAFDLPRGEELIDRAAEEFYDDEERKKELAMLEESWKLSNRN